MYSFMLNTLTRNDSTEKEEYATTPGFPKGVLNFNDTKIGLDKIGVDPLPTFSGSRHVFVDSDYGPGIEPFWISEDSAVIKLGISAIESPMKFWLQNRKQLKEFELMSYNMTTFYDKYWTNHPSLKPYEVIIGGFYVAYREKYSHWFRVRVMNKIYDKEMKYLVQMLDYGSQAIVKLSEIYPFCQHYLKLPIQAVCAELYDLRDNAAIQFSKDQICKFIDDVQILKLENVLVLNEKEKDEDEVFSTIRVFLLKQSIEQCKEIENFADHIYTMNGAIKIGRFKEVFEPQLQSTSTATIASKYNSNDSNTSSIRATSVPATSIPATSVPETSIPATSVPETSIRAASVPATSIRAASVPATSIPATSVPATSIPATSIRAAPVPATSIPSDTSVPTSTKFPSTASSSQRGSRFRNPASFLAPSFSFTESCNHWEDMFYD